MVLNLRPPMFAALLVALAGTSARAAAPPVIEYVLDPARSQLKFVFTQGKAENQGRFRKYDVALSFADANLGKSKLDVVVKIGSLDTGDEQRDGEMLGVNGFDAAKFPEAKFHTVKFSPVSAGRYEAVGKLTLHGVTRDLKVPFAFRTATEKGAPVAYMTGRVSFNRLDYGVGQGQWKSTDEVANEVTVSFGLRLTGKPAAP